MLIPESWMPKCKMTRVHLHWTAGPRIARADELDHYHFIMNQNLALYNGVGIEKNARVIQPNFKPGIDYAAHTKGANSFAIGYSLAGMRLAQESPFIPGPDPITEAQWTVAMVNIAQLCKAYGIIPGPKTVLTHAEVQPNLGIKQNGKWDITRLPFQKDQTIFDTAAKVGDLLRAEVLFILNKGELP